MAFGFARPAAGLIVDRRGRSAPALRYLVEFARAYADTVRVLVPRESAGGDHGPRIAALRAEFPGVDVRVFDDEASAPALRSAPATGSSAARDSRMQDPERLLFGIGSEDIGIAGTLGATLVPVFPPEDGANAAQPAARAAPLRVCLFGPESTGKSTLALALARHYRTVHVPEYVRGYLDATRSTGTAADVPWIARGQRASEVVLAPRANNVLVCDTNLPTIALWSDVLFGDTPNWLRAAADTQHYDLWLLTDIDVPFEADPQRVFPEPAHRAWFMRECERTIARIGDRSVRLRSDHETRLEAACAAIDALLREQ